MEKREKALQEGLINNDEEQKRWELYKKENETAIENLDNFGKMLTVDIMVPIGSKALIPGQICHTNEVFLSHFQGMFSKCSAHQAKIICKKRIEMAKTRLEKLKQEQEMFQNKLDIPRTGALPNEEQQEIIEEYDEEKEKLWREEHKKKMREYKQCERRDKAAVKDENNEKTHEDIMKMLENLELMEELETELDQLEIEDTDTLEKLMSGEIKLPPEKERVSHYSTKSDVIIDNKSINNDDIQNGEVRREKSVIEEIAAKYKNLNVNELQETIDFTNNNSIPNSNDFHYQSDDADSDDPSYADIPEEILKIERETENIDKRQRLRIFKKKLKETEKMLRQLIVKNFDDLNQKAHLLEVKEYLLDYIEILKDEVDDYDDDDDDSGEFDEENLKENHSNKENSKSKKKKISFALEDEIKFIDTESNIIATFKEKEKQKKRDVITLEPELLPRNISSEESNETNKNLEEVNGKTSILKKVEKSCNFVIENQSQQDFNLIDKILSEEENKERTLFIKFKHSDQVFHYPGYVADSSTSQNESSEDIIGSPADIYRIFSIDKENLRSEVNNIKLEDENSANNKEDINLNAYEDPRIKILNQNAIEMDKENVIVAENIPEKKSILKNKDAVKEETHLNEPVISKKVKNKKNPTKENFTGFDMIMGDVIENPITQQPDPLPKEKFVDAHAPRKRISRFKQMRSNAAT